MARPQKILFSSVGQAELVDDDSFDNRDLRPGEVEGRTLYTLISAGTELNLYLGNYQNNRQSWGTLPLVPGYAAVFEVERAGSDVTALSPGDLVFCHGKHRTHQRVDARDTLAVPSDLVAEHVPFARMMNVTMTTLTTTPARPPAKVLVTGLGQVGLLGALVFQICGFRVFGFDPIESRRALAKKAGLENVLAEIPFDSPDFAGQIDLVLECSGHEQAILDGCLVAGDGGEIVIVGVPMVPKTEILAQEILLLLFRKFLTLRGGKEQRLPAHATQFDRNSMFANQKAGLEWLASNQISVSDMYTKISPKEAQRAYQDLLNRRAPSLSYLFDWTAI